MGGGGAPLWASQGCLYLGVLWKRGFVGYGAGVAQLAERLICNGAIASEGRMASNGSVLAFFASVLPS
jgi:hypothetical protein